MSGERAVVLGAGGHAKVVIATLQAAGWAVVAALDDDAELVGGRVLDVEVAGTVRDLAAWDDVAAITAVGDGRARQRLVARVEAERPRVVWATAVHPAAFVHPGVRLGPGSVVFAGAVVQPDTEIGAHAIVNTAASVDHDGRLGDFVHLAPGARLAGHVEVGEGALLGIGCQVLPGRRIGAWAVVGAGATVVRDVGDGWTVVGTPARRRASGEPGPPAT
jgi:sugar O-acyltransferase (sialic acid O-acetyltransferase NeuD family)